MAETTEVGEFVYPMQLRWFYLHLYTQRTRAPLGKPIFSGNSLRGTSAPYSEFHIYIDVYFLASIRRQSTVLLRTLHH